MQRKIWHKMIIGISIPSLIALIGGLLTYGYINDIKKRHDYVQIADDMKEHVLEVRRNEKNFLLHKDSEYFKYLHEATSVLVLAVDNISPKTVSEIGKQEFFEFKATIRDYSSLSEDLFGVYREENNVVELVREEGRKLEAFVATGKHAKELTTSFILNLRRLEKNYMLFRDKDSYVRLDNAISQFKNITPFCFDCAEYLQSIQNLYAVYGKIDEKVNKLQVVGNRLEEISDKIANKERQKVNAFFTHTQRLVLLALLLLCILGPLFVQRTAAYIVAPIIRLAEITKKISEGDVTLRAPLKEQDETYTLAVSFNTMLDHLQLTHHSLEKSMELLREQQIEAEKRASLGFLVSGVAHELNNPLNNISLTAEAIKEDLKDISPEQLEDYVRDILSQTERAQFIVENLLDYVGAHRSTVKKKMDIIGVIKESVNLIANQLRVNNIDLKLDIPDGVFYVKGNRNKLEEVFINIIVNAIHAMKDRGTLGISARPGNEGGEILIEISDTGHGIPEEHLRNIFEPFFTTKPSGEGTGLGLSVAQSIITEHNGEINVESAVGEGTTFKIILPLQNESAGD